MAKFFQQNIAVALELFADRWSRELLPALPLSWQGKWGARRWDVIGRDASGYVSQPFSTMPIALTVPANEILVRMIELPLASRFQLANLMRFEAARHVPMPLDQVRIDFRIVHRDVTAARMLVEMAVVRREAVEAALRESNVVGVKPEAIFFSTQYGPWFSHRFLAFNWQKIFFNQRHRRLYLKIALPVFLALACMLAVQDWAARLAADRDAAVLAARSQAAGIEPLRQQFQALDGTLGFLVNVRNRASAATITEEVARLLPDDAWLGELDIEDQDVRLLGTASHATDLLRVFSGSPLFNSPRFEAPLTQASGSAGDQFDIVMTRN